MKSFLSIESFDLCKIFNTISHIIYAEMTDETRNTLRRVEYQLTREDIELFDKELYSGLKERSDEEILEKFISSYKLSLSPDKYDKYSVYIIFSTIIKEVDYILDRAFLAGEYNKLYVFVPYDIVDTNLEDEESIIKANKIINDIFFNVINLFSDKPVFRGERRKYTAFISDSFGINIITGLCSIFSHLILESEYKDHEDHIRESVEYIMENKIEKSSQYIKLDISTDPHILKDIIKVLKMTS